MPPENRVLNDTQFLTGPEVPGPNQENLLYSRKNSTFREYPPLDFRTGITKGFT